MSTPYDFRFLSFGKGEIPLKKYDSPNESFSEFKFIISYEI